MQEQRKAQGIVCHQIFFSWLWNPINPIQCELKCGDNWKCHICTITQNAHFDFRFSHKIVVNFVRAVQYSATLSVHFALPNSVRTYYNTGLYVCCSAALQDSRFIAIRWTIDSGLPVFHISTISSQHTIENIDCTKLNSWCLIYCGTIASFVNGNDFLIAKFIANANNYLIRKF